MKAKSQRVDTRDSSSKAHVTAVSLQVLPSQTQKNLEAHSRRNCLHYAMANGFPVNPEAENNVANTMLAELQRLF